MVSITKVLNPHLTATHKIPREDIQELQQKLSKIWEVQFRPIDNMKPNELRNKLLSQVDLQKTSDPNEVEKLVHVPSFNNSEL